MFTETIYSDSQREFFFHLANIGVEMDTVILSYDLNNQDFYTLSQSAAVSGMEVFIQRHGFRLEKRGDDIYTTDQHWFAIDRDVEPKGHPITFAEFIGEGYNLKTHQLRLFSYSKDTRRQLAFDGLAVALLAPPYGLNFATNKHLSNKKYQNAETDFLTSVFNNYLRTVLGVDSVEQTTNLLVYRWSDDWSSYFEPGKEYWGNYFYTLLNLDSKTITVIGASTTD